MQDSGVRKYAVRFVFFSACILVCALSCKKKDVVPGTQMQVHIVNAAAGSGSLELLQNLKPIGTFNYLTGLNTTANYRSLDSGFQNYKIRSGSTELASWLSANEQLQYSFIMYDTAATGKLKYFFLPDALDTTGLGKRSKIRLIHVSVDADTLELLTTKPSNPAEDSVLVANRPYAATLTSAQLTAAAAFQNFYADTTVVIKVRRKAAGTVVKQYQLQFAKGGVYSLLLKGYAAKTNADSLSLSVIKHN